MVRKGNRIVDANARRAIRLINTEIAKNNWPDSDICRGDYIAGLKAARLIIRKAFESEEKVLIDHSKVKEKKKSDSTNAENYRSLEMQFYTGDSLFMTAEQKRKGRP